MGEKVTITLRPGSCALLAGSALPVGRGLVARVGVDHLAGLTERGQARDGTADAYACQHPRPARLVPHLTRLGHV